jgi:sterol desaturase/sphingolipid hydroxylase (fatty acid hydroxylase superfamily)
MPDWLLSWMIAPLGVVASAQSDYFLPSLFGAVAVGGLVLLGRGERLAALFPRRIYFHPSARIDIAVWLVNAIFFGRFIAITIGTVTGVLVGASLARASPGGFLVDGWAVRGVYTLAVFCAADFAITAAHLLQHRIPLLWEFHKLHHSARVLMPITGDRQHPVDFLVSGLLAGIAMGGVDAVFTWVVGGSVELVAIGGRNAVDMLFVTFLLHLRHTHVWLSWGPRLGRWVMSPAHHQIHHSVDPRHHGRNLGKFLAVWDRMLGTLHVPGRAPEPLEFGLGPGEDEAFESLWNCYVLPFRRAFGRVAGTRTAPS